MWSVLEESVLLRSASEPGVLAEPLEHLVKLIELPNVTVQVRPLAAGVHPGINGTVMVLMFRRELEGEPGVAYTEARTKDTYATRCAASRSRRILRYPSNSRVPRLRPP